MTMRFFVVFVYSVEGRGSDGLYVNKGANGTYRVGVAIPSDKVHLFTLSLVCDVVTEGVQRLASRFAGEYYLGST